MLPEAYWEKKPKKHKKSKMLLAHFSRLELGALDIIQGGKQVDSDGIRVYKKLDHLLKKPEIRSKMVNAMKPLMKDQSNPIEDHVYKKDLAFLQDVAPKSFEKPTKKKGDAEVHHIEEMGVGGDDSLGWVPESFVELAIDIGYKPIQNPHTHLLMFGKRPLTEKQKLEILSHYGERGNSGIHFEKGRAYRISGPGGKKRYYDFDAQNRPYYHSPLTGGLSYMMTKEELRKVDRDFKWGGIRAMAKPLIRIAAPIAAVALTPFTGGTSLALLGTSALAGGASYGAHRLTGATHKKSIAPALGGALGSVAGGLAPSLGVNASIATGAGQTAGQLLGGAKPKQALLAGALHGAGHYGMSKLNEAGHLPKWLGGTPPATPSEKALAALRNSSAASGAAPAAGSEAASALAPSAPPAASSWGMAELAPLALAPLAIAGGIAGLTYHVQKKRAEEKKKHEEQKVKHHKEELKDFEKQKEALGFKRPWVGGSSEKGDWRVNPDYNKEPDWARELGISDRRWIGKNETPTPWPEDFHPSSHAEGGLTENHSSSHDSWSNIVDEGLNMLEHSPEWSPVTPRRYATGGQITGDFDTHYPGALQSLTESTLIKGPGKGQEDLIKTTVPENSYIIDASTTSMLGDGSTDAGAHVLKQFEHDIKSRVPEQKKLMIEEHIHRTAKQLPVYLSDSEYKFDPLTVALLGDGSEKKGSSILKAMVKNIRKEKSKKGGGLPLKAKSPWYYIEKMER
jgi:hypothetical protein